MKYIFTLYACDMVDICIIIYILSQSLHSLTCTKNYAQLVFTASRAYLQPHNPKNK
jgi:hypothetical protein